MRSEGPAWPRPGPAVPAAVPAKRKGLGRVWHALRYSLKGPRAGWHEPAFRQEALLGLVMLPSAWLLGNTWLEVAVLCGAVVLVWIVELLNTAIESVVDRIGPQWHELSGRAKDMGSAAVLLSLLLCALVWGSALFNWLRG